jgi:iron(III) transport system ATP-binding protein
VSEIRFDAVSLHYAGRGTAAVDDLSLTIADGSFVALVGPSGCGKTTTLRLLAGFLTPDSGTISVDGQVLSSASVVVPPERRGMGMVFQQYAVWPHMTVFDNVAFGLSGRRLKRAEIRKRVDDMLDLVGLVEHSSVYPSQLSGGQQQRVALARSLVVEPRVLLLDEPLSNLDSRLRERMRWELKSLQRRTGITFVYVTHDQTEAMAIADRVAVMHAGQIQQYGSPRSVYGGPANRFVADFMGLVNLVQAEVVRSDSGGYAVVRLLSAPPLEVTVLAARAEAVGALATLVVRPEDVLLASDGGVQARVDQATFLGNINDYVVSVPGSGPAAPLSLRVQAPAQLVLSEGMTVSLSISPERAVLLSDST